MIDGLKPYGEMRATGLPWLPTIPSHWEVHRIKTLLRERDQRTKTGEEPLLSLRMREGIVDHLAAGGKPLSSADLVGYKIVDYGMLVMNRMRASSGLFGVSPSRGLVSPDYAIFRPTSLVDTSYLLYLFKTPMLAQIFRAESKGLGTGEAGFLRLYTDRFGLIGIPLPSIEEQRLIVRFLDAQGALTGRLIRAKRRLIRLLEEQKQAIIHRAVTRGLDPSVRLRPSGIPWLGDIPAHWEVRQVREIARIINGIPFDSAHFSNDSGHPLVRIRDLNKDKTETLFDGDFVAAAAIMPGEVLIGMDGDFNIGSWRGKKPALLNQRMCCVRGRSTILTEFLGFALQHPLKLINELTRSTTVKHLASRQVERIKIAVPSNIDSCSIIAYVHRETDELNRTISTAAREIDLVREFRARLVADIVTGKLDVRAAAAALPDTDQEPEPFEEIEELPEEAIEDADEADIEEAAA